MRENLNNSIILQTSLLNFYGKCGDLASAEHIFKNMKEKDLYSWNAMISCYSQQEKGREAIELFNKMRQEGISPDESTLFIYFKSMC